MYHNIHPINITDVLRHLTLI